MSIEYLPMPVTFSGPSARPTGCPITRCSVVAILSCSFPVCARPQPSCYRNLWKVYGMTSSLHSHSHTRRTSRRASRFEATLRPLESDTARLGVGPWWASSSIVFPSESIAFTSAPAPTRRRTISRYRAGPGCTGSPSTVRAFGSAPAGGCESSPSRRDRHQWVAVFNRIHISTGIDEH